MHDYQKYVEISYSNAARIRRARLALLSKATLLIGILGLINLIYGAVLLSPEFGIVTARYSFQNDITKGPGIVNIVCSLFVIGATLQVFARRSGTVLFGFSLVTLVIIKLMDIGSCLGNLQRTSPSSSAPLELYMAWNIFCCVGVGCFALIWGILSPYLNGEQLQ